TSSGSKEAIDIAKIMAIPVLKIRAPSLKNNDAPFKFIEYLIFVFITVIHLLVTKFKLIYSC
ncbi:hypothetical protein U363_01062, partial [Staphylococcus aureus S39411]